MSPNAGTAVEPAAPTCGVGRVHSKLWVLNGHSFVPSETTDAAFCVLTATGPDTDFLWKLQFAGLACNLYQVSGNDIGLPPPNSGIPAHEHDTSFPRPLYPVYLAPPEVAKGGDPEPKLNSLGMAGPAQV